MTDVDPQFVLGLIAGEGCFTADMYQRDTARFGVSFRGKFIISMNFKEKELLEEVQQALGGVGRVSDQGQGCPEYCVKFTVSSQEEVEEVMSFVDEQSGEGFRMSRKAESFQRFKEYMEIVPPQTIAEAERAVEIATSINDSRAGLSEQEWKKRLTHE